MIEELRARGVLDACFKELRLLFNVFLALKECASDPLDDWSKEEVREDEISSELRPKFRCFLLNGIVEQSAKSVLNQSGGWKLREVVSNY